MKTRFEIAGGTVTGREHVRAGRNNQDAFCWSVGPEALVAVVCDGCSSGRYSELGALLGSRLALEAMARHLPFIGHAAGGLAADAWAGIRRDLLFQLHLVAQSLGGDPARTVSDFLLFTIVGVVVGRDRGWLFSLGDGVAFLNGERLALGRAHDNRPAYLASTLHDGRGGLAREDGFRIHALFPTTRLESLLIGSDGVEDLLASADRHLPGRTERVGGPSALWEDDRNFRNPDHLRRRLSLMNRDSMRPDPATGLPCRQPGLLPDDTTLVVVRRRREDRPCSS